MKPLPIVAIIGKQNVGKSTLFNRIIGKRRAIAHPTPGVTRDSIEENGVWNGVAFTLVDTGGFNPTSADRIQEHITDRIRATAADAAVIIFLVDVDSGITTEDEGLLRELREHRAKMLLAVNKVESETDRWSIHDFHRFGFGDIYPVSALHGTGVAELLDAVVDRFPRKSAPREQDLPRIAIVGRPNVGKSSLVNALVGEERNIVLEEPGTTRDSINIRVRWQGREFTLVDTAGVKRRSRTEKGLHSITSMKSFESARAADIVLMLLDATEEISRQDARVAAEGHRARKGMAIIGNKWDLVERDERAADRFVEKVRRELPFLSYAPVLTVSALTGLRVDRIFPLVASIEEARSLTVPTAKLNKIIERIKEQNPPAYYSGGTGNIYYATQTGTKPPVFTLFVNQAAYFPRSYVRYINNELRKVFTFEGTAIRISLKSKER